MKPSAQIPADSQAELAALDAKINAILPPRYVGCFEAVSPQSMGSAKLAYDKDGKVAWGEIWTSFCHLGLAGGPPHRGSLLEAVTTAEATSQPTEQAAVVAEIKRAIRLTADIPPTREQPHGWVGLMCDDEDMAAWLVRAIVAENVIARHEGNLLYVPAGPEFRIEKEIKNVVVCIAKSCHYLLEHVDPKARPRGFGELIQPPLPDEAAAAPEEQRRAVEDLLERLGRQTTLKASLSNSPAWVGIECDNEDMAIWLQRAVVVENILARREGAVLCVPVCGPERSAAANEKIAGVVAQAQRLWTLHTASN